MCIDTSHSSNKWCENLDFGKEIDPTFELETGVISKTTTTNNNQPTTTTTTTTTTMTMTTNNRMCWMEAPPT